MVESGRNGDKGILRVLDLDEVLMKEVGVFGRYQQRVVAIIAVASMFTAWGGNTYIFTTTRVSTRCLIPECEGSAASEFLPSWLGAAVPTDGDTIDGCRRFAVTNTSSQTCTADLFDQNNVLDCEQFVYEDTNSIVHEFDLGCDEWRRTMVGSLRVVGALLGMAVTGYISDRFGRRIAISIITFLTAFIGCMRYFADTYNGYLIAEIAEGFFGSGFGSSHIMVMEAIGPKYGIFMSATLNSFFSIGQMTLALIAWGVPYWRNLVLAIYAPQLITIFIYWILPESMRWQKSKGRYAEFEASLKKAAKTNGKDLSEETMIALRRGADDELRKKQEYDNNKKNEPWLVIQVFRNKPILLRCVILPICWITVTLVYYGLSINSVGLAGNRYINYLLVSGVEVPGFWLGILAMFKMGRKVTLITAYWLCAVCQIAYIFIPADMTGVLLAVFLVGKFSIAAVAMAVYVYTVELFPTCSRNTLFAFCSMVGRLGAVIAPLTPALATALFEQFPFVLFAGCPLVSGLLLFLLPETLGSSLPDTMEEAGRLGKKPSTETSKL